jgi:endo-1,4-beta-xylanase
MQRIGALGLKVAITELDAPVGADLPDRFEVQAQRMAGMVQACLAVPACDSVTFWGLDDEVSWLNQFLAPNLDPLLFDASLSPKPAYFAVRDQLLEGRPSQRRGHAWICTSPTPPRRRTSGRRVACDCPRKREVREYRM